MSVQGEGETSEDECVPPKKRGRRSSSSNIAMGMKVELEGHSVTPSPDSTDRKKQTHLRCERQRREAINYGYTELKQLLPDHLSPLGCKTTNASILYRTCDYIKQLQGEQKQAETEANKLKAQTVALQIIAQQYEQLALDHDKDDGLVQSGKGTIAQQQFAGFRNLMDSWFDSFDREVITDDYPSLTRSLLHWLEQGIDFEAAPVMVSSSRSSSNRNR